VIPSPGNQPETDRIQSGGWILQDPIGSGIGLVDLGIERELKNQFNLNLKLLDLRKIASDRNIYVHQSIITVDQQKDFLDECRSFQFSAHYKYINILEKLIEKLTEFENATPVTQLTSLNFKN
jgi:hypothetical protein